MGETVDLKDHRINSDYQFPPEVIYEERPIFDPGKSGEAAETGLHAIWITLNNPGQFNSYTTEMVKAIIMAFHHAGMDRRAVAVVLTGAGNRAFCTGGNTKEYAEYYGGRPEEYGQYMDLFIGMVDAILNCKKPTICRVNGMRVAGGQEMGLPCDITVAADTAVFGQAGPRHGSAPDGGATDFLPWFLTIEDAMWSCISCELWSAYKMKRLGLIRQAVRVIKDGDQFISNPAVITDRWLKDGEIVFGEFKAGDEEKQAREFLKTADYDLRLLDATVDSIVWKLTNSFQGCQMKAIDGIRAKKKFFWDQNKLPNRHWLAANMQGEGLLGFTAFNNRKLTGQDVIDFVAYRNFLAQGHSMEELSAAVLPKSRS